MATIEPYPTQTGRRWQVRYRKPDGLQTKKRGFTTKRDAELFLASLTVKQSRGDYVDPSSSKITIQELEQQWQLRLPALKPSTQATMKVASRTHVIPKWGHRQVGSILHSEIQAWVTTLSKERSAVVVRRAHNILSQILDTAVKDNRISTNRAKHISLPQRTKKARNYLALPQVELLAEHSNHPLLILTLAFTGLRWGEATALQGKHINFLRKRIHVERNAVQVAGRIILGTPKTHEQRIVPVPKFLIELLAKDRENKAHEELLFGDGENFLKSSDSRDGWFTQAVLKAQQVDKAFPTITPHDLRHTAASLAISAGANVKVVQKMLGHASAAMTLDTYADLFDDDLDTVSEALNTLYLQARVK